MTFKQKTIIKQNKSSIAVQTQMSSKFIRDVVLTVSELKTKPALPHLLSVGQLVQNGCTTHMTDNHRLFRLV